MSRLNGNLDHLYDRVEDLDKRTFDTAVEVGKHTAKLELIEKSVDQVACKIDSMSIGVNAKIDLISEKLESTKHKVHDSELKLELFEDNKKLIFKLLNLFRKFAVHIIVGFGSSILALVMEHWKNHR